MMIGALALASAVCTSFPYAQIVWADQATRWVIIGEDHGTNEQPAAFAELVCSASEQRRVVVALEQPVSEQAAIDDFLQSDGGTLAQRVFRQSQIWQNSFKDGRSSKAQFRLFESLRKLFKAGRLDGVFASEPVGDIADPGEYETRMGENVKKLSAEGGLVIALVGGVHAMLTPVSFSRAAYLPMAATMPRNGLVSARFVSSGGKQWACTSPIDCGVATLGYPKRTSASRRIRKQAGSSAHSVKILLGSPATASPPEVAPSLNGKGKTR